MTARELPEQLQRAMVAAVAAVGACLTAWLAPAITCGDSRNLPLDRETLVPPFVGLPMGIRAYVYSTRNVRVATSAVASGSSSEPIERPGPDLRNRFKHLTMEVGS